MSTSIATFPDPQLPSKESSQSYWLEPADETLLGHRTTTDIPENADIVIIGSGIAGAQTARYLYEQDGGKWLAGKKVVMLEAREACWGATGRNGGHCKPSLYHHPALHSPNTSSQALEETVARIRFELKNFEALSSYIESNSIPCDFERVPACDAFFDHESFDEATSSIKTLQSIAPDVAAHLRIVTEKAELRDELRVPTAVGAVVFEAAKLWPYKLVCWTLKDLIQNKGLNLQTLTPVLGISTLNPDAPVPLHRIHTERGSITTSIVIHATNAFASHLLPQFRDCIYPVRAQMAALKAPKSMIDRPLKHSYGLYDGDRIKSEYLIQSRIYGTEGGDILVGGGRKYANYQGVGVTNDYDIDREVATYLKTSVGKFFEEDTLTAEFEWSGIMGFSADEMPWVGKVSGPEGQYMLAGFEGHGMSLATASALGLAQIIHHRYTILPENPFSENWHQTVVRALHSFNPAADPACRLAKFAKGDLLDIQEKASNGWWFGKIISSNGASTQNTLGGWFPSNYVTSVSNLTDGTIEREVTANLIRCLGELPPHFTWFPNSFLISQARLDAASAIIDGSKLHNMMARPHNLPYMKKVWPTKPTPAVNHFTYAVAVAQAKMDIDKVYQKRQLAKSAQLPSTSEDAASAALSKEAAIMEVTEIYLEAMKRLTALSASKAPEDAKDGDWEVI